MVTCTRVSSVATATEGIDDEKTILGNVEVTVMPLSFSTKVRANKEIEKYEKTARASLRGRLSEEKK